MITIWYEVWISDTPNESDTDIEEFRICGTSDIINAYSVASRLKSGELQPGRKVDAIWIVEIFSEKIISFKDDTNAVQEMVWIDYA